MLAHVQGAPLNASQLARSLSVSAPTVSNYIDLLVDLLLVRRLPPFHSNTAKRMVKPPKTSIRDSGLVHALLNIETLGTLLDHPVSGVSWKGSVTETLLNIAPAEPKQASTAPHAVLKSVWSRQSALGYRNQARQCS